MWCSVCDESPCIRCYLFLDGNRDGGFAKVVAVSIYFMLNIPLYRRKTLLCAWIVNYNIVCLLYVMWIDYGHGIKLGPVLQELPDSVPKRRQSTSVSLMHIRLDIYLPRDQLTSYLQISWCLAATSYRFKGIRSLWNLTGAFGSLLLRWMPNSKAATQTIGSLIATGLLNPRSPHDDVIKWNHFSCYWSFLRGIHRSTVDSPHKGQWRGGALRLSLICARTNDWANN